MSADLVARLTRNADSGDSCRGASDDMREAAAALTAQQEQLQAWRDESPFNPELTAALRVVKAQQERITELERAVRWALGYNTPEIDAAGEPFRPRGEGDPPYWWRDELQRRAAIGD